MLQVTPSFNPWLRISQPNPRARLRLFCFPYAGGAASIYRTWHKHLPADIEVCAVQLPGRENRINEEPLADAGELVQALMPDIVPYLDRPFAFFGHSMGTVIAYELAQQLRSHGKTPTHLFVSGRRAPHLPEPDTLLHTLTSDDAFLAELQRRYNNIPAIVFEHAEMREIFTPLLRADLTLVETCECRTEPALHCPIIAFGGDADGRASSNELMAWQELTQSDFDWHLFPGGHFYLAEQAEPLLAILGTYLMAW